MLWGARLLTSLCLFYIFRSALAPPSGAGLIPWDKAAHFCAFYVLANLVAISFPRLAYAVLVAMLLAVGVLIEMLQALPEIGRDASGFDVLADMIGVAAAYCPVIAFRVRSRLRAALKA